ncbi:MAG: DUF2190 family protein [Paracoccus sp. (in: a-proteobacteria)]
MKNFIQAGDHITVPAAADIASGSPAMIGNLFGVAEHSALAGEDVTLARLGVFILPKATGQAWAAGVRLYWDATNGVVTTTASGNQMIGAVAVAAIAGAVVGAVLLDGAIR